MLSEIVHSQAIIIVVIFTGEFSNQKQVVFIVSMGAVHGNQYQHSGCSQAGRQTG